MTGHAALDAYARRLRRLNVAPETFRAYISVARRFLRDVGKLIGRISRDDVRRYLAARSAHLSASSQVVETYRVRAFLSALVQEGLLASSPAERLGSTRANTRPPTLLSERAVARLLRAASIETPRRHRTVALRDRALFELAYGLGLRASELCAARLVDLDLREGTLLVRRAKRGKPRALPITPAARRHLLAYVREARPVLAQRGGGRDQGRLLLTAEGKPITYPCVMRVVTKAANRAGFSAHPHALRRALATGLARAGVSLLVVQELLGHARLDTTAIYVEVERDDLRRAVEILER